MTTTLSLFDLASRLTASGNGPIWLQLGRLFDGAEVKRDVHLVYDRSRILHVGDTPPSGLLRDGRRRPDLELPHHTGLPSLIEAHAHLFLEGGELDPMRRAEQLQRNDATLLAQAIPRLERLVRLGVGAVRDAGDRNGVGLAIQRLGRTTGRRWMPAVESPGAAIHHQGRYGAFMGRALEDQGNIEAAVAERIAAGARHIKLLATGIINFEKGAVLAKPQMPVEELTVAVQAARRASRQTMIHCSGNDGVANCIAARVDTVEHGFFVDREQLARMRDLDIAWVPTFAPVQFQLDRADLMGWSDTVRGNLQRILDGHAASLVHAAEIGVRIVAGSDAGSHGVPHGHGLLWELELMERAGLSTLRTLRTATGEPAGRLGLERPGGMLAPGCAPHFLLTSAPVLDSVRHLRRPSVVCFEGEGLVGGDDPSLPGL